MLEKKSKIEKPKKAISSNPVTNLPQECYPVQLQYLDFDWEEVKLKSKVYPVDVDGNKLEGAGLEFVKFYTLSNRTRVDKDWNIIDEKYVIEKNNLNPDDENYEEQLKTLLEAELEVSEGEFDLFIDGFKGKDFQQSVNDLVTILDSRNLFV